MDLVIRLVNGEKDNCFIERKENNKILITAIVDRKSSAFSITHRELISYLYPDR